MRILGLFLVGTMLFALFTGCIPSPPDTQSDMAKKDFTLPLLGGGILRLSDFLGKPVLLVFFTPTCSNCKKEAPLLETVYQRYKESHNFVVIGVGYISSNGEEELREFVENNGITFPVAMDTDETRVYRMYGVTGVPHNFFFNREGNIVRSATEPLTLTTLEQYLQTIL